MKHFKNCLVLFTSFYLLNNSLVVFANAKPSFVPSSQIINQRRVLNQLKSQTSLPVIFPTKIPSVTKGQLEYASYSSYGVSPNFEKFWQINIDATPTCRGIKTCNIGFISAERNGKLDSTYQTLPDNKFHQKEQIKLKNNITGYFTPFHIQASGVNPTLEWQINGVLYTLSWKINAEPSCQREILTVLADSAYLQAKF